MEDVNREEFVKKIEEDLQCIKEKKFYLSIVAGNLVYTQERKKIRRRKIVLKGLEEIESQNRIRNMSVKERADNFVLKDYSSLTSKDSLERNELIRKTKGFYEKKKSEILKSFRERQCLPVKADGSVEFDSRLMEKIKEKQKMGNEGIFKKKKRTHKSGTVMRRRNSRSIRRNSAISIKSSSSFKEAPTNLNFFKKEPAIKKKGRRRSKKRRSKKLKIDTLEGRSAVKLPSEKDLMVNKIIIAGDNSNSSRSKMPEFGLDNLNKREYFEDLMDNFVKNIAQDVEEFNDANEDKLDDPVLGDSIIARIVKKREQEARIREEENQREIEKIKAEKFKEEKLKLLKKKEKVKMIKASIKFSMNFRKNEERPKVHLNRKFNPIFRSMNTNQFYMRTKNQSLSKGTILKKRSKNNVNSLKGLIGVIKTEPGENNRSQAGLLKKKKGNSSKRRGRSASFKKKKKKRRKKHKNSEIMVNKLSKTPQEKPTVDEIKVIDSRPLEEYNSWDEL